MAPGPRDYRSRFWRGWVVSYGPAWPAAYHAWYRAYTRVFHQTFPHCMVIDVRRLALPGD